MSRSHKHSDSTHDSPYALRLQKGFAWLRFDDSLESAFRAHYNARNLTRARVIALLGVFLFLVFAVQNYMDMPTPVRAWAFWVQALFIVPWLFLVWAATYHRLGTQYLNTLVAIAVIGVVAGLLTVICYVHLQGFAYPYEGLMLILIAVWFALGLRFFVALSLSVTIVLAYLLCEILVGAPTDIWVRGGMYLTSANLISALGAYTYEHLERKNYLSTELLRSQANRDGLTGLHNRRYLEEQLPRLWLQARRERSRIAVAFFDVDYFKAYNDAYGHLEGDDCLREIARTLHGEARRPLDLVVRYGGEEFLIVWYALEPAEILTNLTERVQKRIKALRLAHKASSVAQYITVSGGAVAAIPASEGGMEAFLSAADSALYQAKMGGRDQVVVVPDMVKGRIPEHPIKSPEISDEDMHTTQPAQATQPYRHHEAAVSRLNYQFVLLTRYRRPMFDKHAALVIRQVVRDLCARQNIVITKGRVRADHLELLLNLSPSQSPEQVLAMIKEQVALVVAEQLPGILANVENPQLWEQGYYAVTLGEVDTLAIDRYVDSQRVDDAADDDFQIPD